MLFKLTNSNVVLLVASCAAAGSLASVCGMNQLIFVCSCLLLSACMLSWHLFAPDISSFLANAAQAAPQRPGEDFSDSVRETKNKPINCDLRILVVYGLLFALPIFFYWRANQCEPVAGADDLAQFAGREVVFIAQLCADESVHAHLVAKPEMLVFPKKMPLSGRSLLMFPLPADISEQSAGRLRISAFVRMPERQSAPWEFDQRRYLAEHDIYSLCFRAHLAAGAANVVKDAAVSEPDGLSIFWQSICAKMKQARERMVATHRRHLTRDYGDLLSSIVLGNKAVALDASVTKRYRDVGLSHLLAASGFNLTIVTVMSIAVCGLFTRSMLIANALSGGSILAFVMLAGPSPSVVRAALMCLTVLLARNSKRRVKIVSVLALAFIVTDLCDPRCVADLGFQLSYASTFGILCGATRLAKLIYAGRQRLLKNLISSLSLVLIAQASVLPIQLFNFWQTGTLFLPANLVAEPLITPITILGFASSVLCLFQCQNWVLNLLLDWFTGAIDFLAFVPLKILDDFVYFLSTIQGCRLSLGPPVPWSIAIYYLCFGLLFFSLNKRMLRLFALIAFATALSFLLFFRPPPAKLTLALLHNSLIIIDKDHHAVALSIKRPHGRASAPCGQKGDEINVSKTVEIGDAIDGQPLDPSVEKFLAYHAAHIDRRYFRVCQQANDVCLTSTLSVFKVIVAFAHCTACGATEPANSLPQAHPQWPSAPTRPRQNQASQNILLLLEDGHVRCVASDKEGFVDGLVHDYNPGLIVIENDGRKSLSSSQCGLGHQYVPGSSAQVQIEHSCQVYLSTLVKGVSK